LKVGDDNRMISDILKKENVQILDSVSSWQEAIYVSTKNLVEKGYVTKNYPQKIIELTKKYGAYYVLGPDVALVHARPEDGVIHKQLAITLLKKPVKFDGKEDTVRLIIALAAEDSQSHLKVLKQIAEILSDSKKLQSIIKADDADNLYERFVNAS
jgi:mannitol/fructose-specific phosphotransferase system IIA component (Ntr-type)